MIYMTTKEPIIIKHRDRFKIRKGSVFWDMLEPKLMDVPQWKSLKGELTEDAA